MTPAKDSSSSRQQALRRRRNQVATGIQRIERDERKLHRNLSAQNAMSTKVYFAGFGFFILVLLSVLLYVEPRLFSIFWKTSRGNSPSHAIKRWRLVSALPANVSLMRDLPVVVGSYAIETPQNEPAREVIKHYHQQKRILRSRAYILSWRLLEHAEFDWYAHSPAANRTCGSQFSHVYDRAPGFVQHDLVVSCWLRTEMIQGVLPFGVEFYQAIPSYHDNVAVRYYGLQEEEEDAKTDVRMLSPFLLVNDPLQSIVGPRWHEWLAELVLSGNLEEDESAYRDMLGRKLQEWIQEDENGSSPLRWDVLDAVCGEKYKSVFDTANRIMLGTLCHGGSNECCDIWDQRRAQPQTLSPGLGGVIVDSADDEADVSSLRRRKR